LVRVENGGDSFYNEPVKKKIRSNRNLQSWTRRTRLLLGLAVLPLALFSAEAARWRIGAASTVVTPFLDTPMAGYYYDRQAEGVHDDLRSKTLIIDDGRSPVVLVAVDAIHVTRDVVDQSRRLIGEKWGIPADRIMISATHCHTGPKLTPDYRKSLSRWIADGVRTAMGELRPTSLKAGVEAESSIAHYRRYRMKDGSVRTNPGFLNPDIVRPVGEIDSDVGILLALDDRDRPLATWVNYAMHQDTVGGTLISADYAHFLAAFLSRVQGPEMLTVFTIGAAGNINHWDVGRPGPQRGFSMAETLGQVLAAAVIRGYTRLETVAPVGIHAASVIVDLPVASISSGEIVAARKAMAKPMPPGVDFTMDRVRQARAVRLGEQNGKPVSAEVQVFRLGDVAIVGLPGEVFVELGRAIKKESPFPVTFIVELANDNIGYIPTTEAFAQGGYEPTSSILSPGAGEKLAAKAVELLRKLK
jgi:neutral ceramidase